jgi:hypothetical protein
MRLNGVEPSRVFPPTRPSTLRVYQFRHSRSRAADSRLFGVRGAGGVAGIRGGRYPANKCSDVFLAGKWEKLGADDG